MRDSPLVFRKTVLRHQCGALQSVRIRVVGETEVMPACFACGKTDGWSDSSDQSQWQVQILGQPEG